MTIYDAHASRSRARPDMSAVFALIVILAVIGTLALDAYAFSTLQL